MIKSKLSEFISPVVPSTHYRPDIDGLRAFSILAVVIFHAFPRVLKGGFLGVDVFFVISGFLITSFLLRKMARAAAQGRGVGIWG
ncbi:MAG: hypothetical protein LUC43_08190, partial [Burkholderiales bacterium]|nr:hypothetical protein [Burkholderiales bacterium]